MENKKGFIIFDQQLAGYLMLMKHRMINSRKDRECETKNVYVFAINDTFMDDLRKFNEIKYDLFKFLEE